MPSFDVVSEVDKQEVDNALNQTRKEVGQRYDFKGAKTEITEVDDSILIVSPDRKAAKKLAERIREMLE